MTMRYQVTGTNMEGDTWTFGTDYRERAEAALEDMRKDLVHTKLTDTQGWKASQ